jgi:hypothetical protein
MINSPVTGATVRRAWAQGLRDRGRAYVQTGVTDPYFTGFVVFVVTTGLCGITNVVDYLKKKKTGKEAVSDTFKESAKMGVCSIIGITAGNGVAGTGLVLIAPAVLPLTAGITATYLLKRFWDKHISGTKDAAPVAPSIIS